MEDILNKIKKCLALSQSSEPHEAAAALRQAQKLMEKHGVSQADLQLADVGEVKIRSTASVSRVKDWELAVLNLVTKSFGCALIWAKGSSYGVDASDVFGHYTLVGLKSQVSVAEYTAQVLLRKLRKARAEFVRGLPEHYSRQLKTKEADGFCLGWTDTIKKTVHEFAASAEYKDTLKQYMGRNYGRMKSAKVQNRAVGAYGYGAGAEAASGESLQRPMNGQGEVRRLN